jgi:hypothetical protein
MLCRRLLTTATMALPWPIWLSMASMNAWVSSSTESGRDSAPMSLRKVAVCGSTLPRS